METIEREGYEFRLAPLAFYDGSPGLHGGFNGTHLIPLSKRWQIQIEITEIFQQVEDGWANYFNASWGFTFNFGENIPRSWFAGAGYGIGNVYAHLKNIPIPKGASGVSSYGYFDFGKRFQITESGSFSFVPMISVMSSGADTALWMVRAINFAWNF